MIKCGCGERFEPVIEYKHRLLCGDSTEAGAVGRLMGEYKISTVMTDPPYGYNKGIHGDEKLETALYLLEKSMRIIYNTSASNVWAIVDTPKKFVIDHISRMTKVGWIAKEPVLTMYRNSMLNGCYGTNIFELSWVYTKGKPKNNRNINGVDIIKVGGAEKNPHPTQKFTKAYGHFIKMFSSESDIVYDPFLGSGTTLLAAHQLTRRCFGIEIHPPYVAVCLQRLTATGLTPERLEA